MCQTNKKQHRNEKSFVINCATEQTPEKEDPCESFNRKQVLAVDGLELTTHFEM